MSRKLAAPHYTVFSILLSLLCPNILLNTLNLYSSPNIRQTKFHTHKKTTGTIKDMNNKMSVELLL